MEHNRIIKVICDRQEGSSNAGHDWKPPVLWHTASANNVGKKRTTNLNQTVHDAGVKMQILMSVCTCVRAQEHPYAFLWKQSENESNKRATGSDGLLLKWWLYWLSINSYNHIIWMEIICACVFFCISTVLETFQLLFFRFWLRRYAILKRVRRQQRCMLKHGEVKTTCRRSKI